MGTATNGVICNKCNCDFCLILEWKHRLAAIKEIKEAKCPECGSDDFSFTDEMGQ